MSLVRWRSWLSHLSNTQKVLSSSLGRIIISFAPPFSITFSFHHSMYLYELPTTGGISFSDFCADQTSNRRHLVHLPAATEARANFRAALKDSKRTDQDQKDFLCLVKVSPA